MKQKKKGSIGFSFDSFLAELAILQECQEQAIEQILADQIKAARLASNDRPRVAAADRRFLNATVR